MACAQLPPPHVLLPKVGHARLSPWLPCLNLSPACIDCIPAAPCPCSHDAPAPLNCARTALAPQGKRYGIGDSDQQLMDKLGEILGGNMKEDFIVVHLQEVCTFCRTHILGGSNVYRYHATGHPKPAVAERKFEGIKLESGPNVPIAPVTSLQICEGCWEEETVRYKSMDRLRLPPGVTPMNLTLERLDPTCTVKDPDTDMENEFFETRQSFLSLCQGNHYQFDTLRRAKHSSMMVLYHIHNPTAPAFASNCNVCNKEMEAGTGFRCTVCTDFDICASCQGTKPHEHPVVVSLGLVKLSFTADTERPASSPKIQPCVAWLRQWHVACLCACWHEVWYQHCCVTCIIQLVVHLLVAWRCADYLDPVGHSRSSNKHASTTRRACASRTRSGASATSSCRRRWRCWCTRAAAKTRSAAATRAARYASCSSTR